MKLRILSLAAIFIFAASLAFAQSPGKDDEALKGLIRQMTDAQMAYDAAALGKLLSADYIEISPLGEFDPREKVLGFYTPEAKAGMGKMSASLQIEDYSIRRYGGFAIVITRFNYSMMNEGKPLPPRSIRVTFVLKKEKGGWKIASAQYTGIRSVQPPK